MQKRDWFRWLVGELQNKYKINVVKTRELYSIDDGFSAVLTVTKEIHKQSFEKEKDKIFDKMKSVSKELEKMKADNLDLNKKNKKLVDTEEEIARELRVANKTKDMYKQDLEELKNQLIEKQEKISRLQDKYISHKDEFKKSENDYKIEIATLNEKLEQLEKIDQIKTEEIEKLQKELDHIYETIFDSDTKNEQGFFKRIISFFK